MGVRRRVRGLYCLVRVLRDRKPPQGPDAAAAVFPQPGVLGRDAAVAGVGPGVLWPVFPAECVFPDRAWLVATGHRAGLPAVDRHGHPGQLHLRPADPRVWRPRRAVCGVGLYTLGFIGLFALATDAPYWRIAVCYPAVGFGAGIITPAATSVLMSVV